MAPEIRTVEVMRYVTPLREGGSLPAIAEADDDFLYVVKFRGAGQGIKALIAELIGGMLAKQAQLKVPEIVFAQLDEAFGRTEPDEEIQDLLRASTGLNLGLHYLQGSVSYDPAVHQADGLTASKIVWLDAFLSNVDRTFRNTNLLMWNRELWLIDHGAALYFHHSPSGWEEHAIRPFTLIKDHVLLPLADRLQEADEIMRQLLTEQVVSEILSLLPEQWLTEAFDEPAAISSERYYRYLTARLQASHIFLKEAINAREKLI